MNLGMQREISWREHISIQAMVGGYKYGHGDAKRRREKVHVCNSNTHVGTRYLY